MLSLGSRLLGAFFFGSRGALAVLLIVAAGGCANAHGEGPGGAADGDRDDSDVTYVHLASMTDLYDGADVWVDGVLGTVGSDPWIEVRPAIRGDRFDVLVREGAVEQSLSVEFRFDVDQLGFDPTTVRTEGLELALLRGADGSCFMGRPTHQLGGWSVSSTYAIEMYERCGPFAP